MRVEDKYMSGIGPSELNRAQAAEVAKRQTGKGVDGAGPGGGTDEVALSTLTERLQGLSAHLEETGEGSPSREARLKELSAVVQSGKYEPDLEALSGKLIDSMQAERT